MLMKLAVVASLVVACLAEEAVRQKRSSGYEDEHDDRKYGGGYGSDDGYGSDHGYGRPEKKHDYGHDKKDYYKSKCCRFIWSVVLE